RPNATPAEAPERTERPADFPEIVDEDRTTLPPSESTPPPIALPDLLPELNPAAPEAATAAAPALEIAAETPQLEEETAAARLEGRPPLARIERSPIIEPDGSLPAERAAPEATERVDETFD